jgi:hypothetical protein
MNRKALGIAGFAAVLALAAGACGGDERPGETAGTGVPPSPEAPAKVPPEGTVFVRLVDFVIETNPESVSAGEITFDVRNDGLAVGDNGEQIPSLSGGVHDFWVLKTDLAPGDLPQLTMVSGQPVDTEAPGIEVVDSLPPMDGDTRERLTTELEPGTYALICNRDTHYERGMWAAFSVR